MMMAMSVQCETCGSFIYKGTKFNMRKEDVLGEDYLGIQIFRFYFRCPNCSSEITFKTDPKNSDYIVEHGAHRTAEPWKKRAVRHRGLIGASADVIPCWALTPPLLLAVRSLAGGGGGKSKEARGGGGGRCDEGAGEQDARRQARDGHPGRPRGAAGAARPPGQDRGGRGTGDASPACRGGGESGACIPLAAPPCR